MLFLFCAGGSILKDNIILGLLFKMKQMYIVLDDFDFSSEKQNLI